MQRLLIIRHAATPATRSASFPTDEPLDPAGLDDARALRGTLGSPDRVLASPALRARQTAEAAGLAPVVDQDLAECDFGSWAGMTLREVGEADPEGLRAWREDPLASPHGGESLAQLVARVERFLERAGERAGTTVAVTHGGPAKAAVLSALRAPFDAFWNIDVAPTSITELHQEGSGWRVVRTNWTVIPCPP